MLAHKAEEEGVFVAEFIAGQKPHINYNLIPGVVYTWPEVADCWVNGRTTKRKRQRNIKLVHFQMRRVRRSRASMDIDGSGQSILADSETDEILGVHMIGATCG